MKAGKTKWIVVGVLLLYIIYFVFIYTVPAFNLNRIDSRKALMVATITPILFFVFGLVFIFHKTLFTELQKSYKSEKVARRIVTNLSWFLLLFPVVMLTLMTAKMLTGGVLTPLRWGSVFAVLVGAFFIVLGNREHKYESNGRKGWRIFFVTLEFWLAFTGVINLVDLLMNYPELFLIG